MRISLEVEHLKVLLNQDDKYKYKYTVLFCEPYVVKTIQLRHFPLAYTFHAFDIAVSLDVFKVGFVMQAARVELNKTVTFSLSAFFKYALLLAEAKDNCFKVEDSDEL